MTYTEADYEADLASPTCECDSPKTPGIELCDACMEAVIREEGRDYEEEERQKRLLKALPDGVYSASELLEYLE